MMTLTSGSVRTDDSRAVFLVIGLVVGGRGLYECRSGVAHGKYGGKVEGTQGKVLAIVRMVIGAGCILFALYKMVAG